MNERVSRLIAVIVLLVLGYSAVCAARARGVDLARASLTERWELLGMSVDERRFRLITAEDAMFVAVARHAAAGDTVLLYSQSFPPRRSLNVHLRQQARRFWALLFPARVAACFGPDALAAALAESNRGRILVAVQTGLSPDPLPLASLRLVEVERGADFVVYGKS